MNIQELIAMEAEASEAARDQPPPPGVKPVRRGRGEVLSIRLNHDELAALTATADGLGVPTSTMARTYIVRGLRGDATPLTSQIEAAVMSALERFEAVKAERATGETPTTTKAKPAKAKAEAS